MKVELIDRSNGDLLAINSARVSMAKHHDTFDPDTDRRLLAYLARENHFTPYTHARMTIVLGGEEFSPLGLSETERAGMVWAPLSEDRVKVRHSVWGWVTLVDAGALPAMAEHAVVALLVSRFPECARVFGLGTAETEPHWLQVYCVEESTETDPRFIDVTFRLTAPIPVVRQIQKTMVGLALNEVSRRYVDEAPTFDTPVNWRARPTGNIKQGSGDELNYGNLLLARLLFATAREVSRFAYAAMIRIGVAPEQARWALLQAMETQGYFTYSLATLKRLHDLRADGHAQAEAGEVVRQMSLAVACSDVAEVWVNQ